MSVLRLDTSVSHLDIDDAFLVESTEVLAKTLKKPKSVSTLSFFYKTKYIVFIKYVFEIQLFNIITQYLILT